NGSPGRTRNSGSSRQSKANFRASSRVIRCTAKPPGGFESGSLAPRVTISSFSGNGDPRSESPTLPPRQVGECPAGVGVGRVEGQDALEPVRRLRRLAQPGAQLAGGDPR